MAGKTERKADMAATSLPYAVNLWGSKPGTTDDCWSGADFATLGEARAAFEDLELHEFDGLFAVSPGTFMDTAWVELDGPDVHEERQNPHYKPSQRSDWEAEWRQERAMQAGMAFGCQGYNDEMGW